MSDALCVLYAEDDTDIREVVSFVLEDDGFQVIECRDGREAVLQGGHCSPDLILLDMMMPELDGLMTLERLRQYPSLARTPVVFMTAKVDEGEIRRYRSSGAVEIIRKPFDALDLPATLRAILEKTRRKQ